ncbi:MAG: hypothetical protein ACJ759_18290 [Thermoanaerobaculia bacterium]
MQTHSRSFPLPLLGLLLLAGPAHAATLPDHPWCGTRRPGIADMAERTAIHREQQRRLERERAQGLRAESSSTEAARVGDVAVIVDDGSLIVQPNRLDLEDFGIQYAPHKKGGFVVSPSSDPIDPGIGERIELADDDARAIKLPKGFKFRFYKKLYTTVYVHSDGNLTFKAPDAASTDRSLFRLISDPPRVAPLFADLDPSASPEGGGVHVATSRTKIVVTWLDVPSFGTTNRNTFQVVLHSSGRITFAYGRLDAQEAVVGVAPGTGGKVQLVDYTGELPAGAVGSAIAERFAAQRDIDHLAIAQAFFREFADEYDHLVVFLDFAQNLGGAFAFESTVKNEIKGLGIDVFDASAAAGSRGRLRAFVQMGTLSRYPENPEQDFLGTNNTLDVLGQETGHRWLAFFGFRDENGQNNRSLLGRDDSHWSFCHNSLASDMEGNQFREDGGDRFTVTGATERFSPLDQYAMGLISADDVPPFYYVDGCPDRAAAPQLGAVIQGRRVDVTVDQIVAAEGARVPASNKAAHSFNMAFIVVGDAGRFPSEASIAKVDRIRAAWEPYFAQATDGRGAVSTALKLKR